MRTPPRTLASAFALIVAIPGTALAGGGTDAIVGNPPLVTAAALAMAFAMARMPRRRR